MSIGSQPNYIELAAHWRDVLATWKIAEKQYHSMLQNIDDLELRWAVANILQYIKEGCGAIIIKPCSEQAWQMVYHELEGQYIDLLEQELVKAGCSAPKTVLEAAGRWIISSFDKKPLPQVGWLVGHVDAHSEEGDLLEDVWLAYDRIVYSTKDHCVFGLLHDSSTIVPLKHLDRLAKKQRYNR